MHPRQYVYFALRSYRMAAAEMAARLGIEPDETSVRGSRHSDPPVPVCHVWRIVCRQPDLTVDEQLDHVVDRLFAEADRIGVLAAELDRTEPATGSAVLQVVRYFEGCGDDEAAETAAPQRNLLGWHVSARILDFLRRTRAELDVDEYGC
ncbi:DUF4279 domain-containing protein [Catellatospora sp. NPDC049609]|uniref:DUF4279 domain-containing protein n=1 Tax=Catellatospora sp. NPDC049609 TaxID=3155505 RepID=UPI0034175BFA